MKILFGVFDWGLGHATRCIPLIEEVVKKNDVHIITTGRPLKILSKRFGKKCKYYDVPSLYPIYSKTFTGFFQIDFAIFLPSLLKSLKVSREISGKIIREGKFDKVISDCRYDVYDNKNNSFLINHQLRFKTVFGFERIAEKWLASRMEDYHFIIVPDFPKKNLSGRLSHNLRYIPKGKIKYIGILSHLKKKDIKKDIDYFFSLSGPEKTRIKLEKKILEQIDKLDGKIVIAGGNPDIELRKNYDNVEHYSFLESEKQQLFMNRSKFLIIRSGYTTMMELAELDKNALLIPSPGQTEQEYLGDYCEEEEYFHHVHQSKLELVRDVALAKEFSGFRSPWKTEESVKKFMKLIF